MKICAEGVAYVQTVWLLTRVELGVWFLLNGQNLNAIVPEYRLLFIRTV